MTTEIVPASARPLYDVLHLGNVLSRGHSPTSGEMTWAVVDDCFVIADVLSLAAIQPEGAVAAVAVRSEVKAAAREGAGRPAESSRRPAAKRRGRAWHSHGPARAPRRGGTAAAEAASASRRVARWWAVRSAGGVYPVLQRLPDALPRMSLTQVVAMGRPLCVKAGIKPSSWKPIQLLKAGVAIPLQIPPERGLKYLAAQMLQASVGVVGFQKMEEHLSSRRPKSL